MPRIAELLNAIIATTEAARAIDLSPYEGTDPDRIGQELLPQIASLLDRSIELLDRLLESGEALGLESEHDGGAPVATTDSLFLRRIDELMGGENGTQLEDLAFLARFELVGRRQGLAGSTDARHDETEQLALCDACRRKILKTLTAVENALSLAAGREPELDFRSELVKSLDVRRVIARCRQRLLSGGEVGQDKVAETLQTAATSLAWLIGHEVYPELRLGDRLELRRFQQRLIRWKKEEGSNPRSGHRLWQDLQGFCDVLRKVNHRTELMQHDLRLVAEAKGQLFGGSEPLAEVPTDLLSRLGDLVGRDSAVDQLLASESAGDAAAWAEPLDRLLEILSPNLTDTGREWKRGDTLEIYPSQYVPPE